MKIKISALLFLFLLAGCTTNQEVKEEKAVDHVSISIKDLTAPKIELKQEEVSLHVGDTFSVSDYVISVTDNYDENIKYKTTGDVDTKKTGDYTITISAKDAAGNSTNKKLFVHVLEVIKENVKNEESCNQNSTENNSNPSNNNFSTSPSNPLPPTNTPMYVHPYSGKQYLFSDGYNNITASQACSNDLLSIPNTTGSCSAIYDSNGEPIGMQLK